MSYEIAVAGKGGTGKTTIASLIVRYLLKQGLGPILAVDADSNFNLNDLLGLNVNRTIGSAREEMKEGSVPIGMTKEVFMEYKTQEALVESEGFDLIAMGRPEGPGCYCYANSLLVKYLEILVKNYRYVVIDNEAGMEHISRLTTQSVNLLIIVSDSSQRGIMTAGRIRDLIQELKISVDRACLIVNRVPDGLDLQIQKEIDRLGLDLVGTVPVDEEIYRLDMEGRPMTGLPDESKALQAVFRIMEKILPDGAEGERE